MKTIERPKTPTIKDIASACGVSAATVSYVINGKSVLRPETRERIFKTMREMNYFPNALARGLQTKSMYAIGVMLGAVGPSEFIVNPYTSGILQGVIREARRSKFHVTLFTNDWISAEISGPTVRDGRTDGVVLVAPILGTDVMTALPAIQPNVVAISAPPSDKVDVVDVDDYEGGRLAARYLASMGHTRIAYLTGNDDLYSHKPRLSGFLDGLAAAGIEPEADLIQVSHFDGSLAARQALDLMGRTKPPTAIFGGNDTIAIAATEALIAAGFSVPRDVSILGYDDMPAAGIVTPRLTTVRQPLSEIAEQATRLLIERIVGAENEQPHRKAQAIKLSPSLVERQTVARLVGK
jgi:LacI family transcriptional regulator